MPFSAFCVKLAIPNCRLERLVSILHVDGAANWSWADIRNNGAISVPTVNPWNEKQAHRCSLLPQGGEVAG